MGQRSSTETLFGIVAAFLERRTWTQAELARKLETRVETVRRQLGELQAAGLKLHREEDHPHVYWSVPKNWIPGALAFSAEEAGEVLRLVSRAPRGALRERVVKTALARLANLGDSNAAFDPDAVRAAGITADEERWLAVVEDAAAGKVTLEMRYYSASRRHESRRHASVQRVEVGGRPQFVAICHRAGELRRFRVSNVFDARLAPAEPFRPATAAALATFDRESFGGYHDVGPAVRCAFVVRDPEAAWVAKNLPDERIEHEPAEGGGVRFSIETPGVAALARFVVGLGEVGRAETPELAAEVRAIARAALANASDVRDDVPPSRAPRSSRRGRTGRTTPPT
ncbi:MAG: WYL domain-containing protein [Labilithrix sp.]|nr:WYL domain-containing protein [Labilithrix sp.]